jgi:tetratricopeptide (TPR) repeat protein
MADFAQLTEQLRLANTPQELSRAHNDLAWYWSSVCDSRKSQLHAVASKHALNGSESAEALAQADDDLKQALQMTASGEHRIVSTDERGPKYELAINCLRRSFKTFETVLGFDSSVTAGVRDILAGNMICVTREETHERRLLFEQAYRVAEDRLGPRHRYTLQKLTKVAYMSRQLGEMRRALHEFEKAFDGFIELSAHEEATRVFDSLAELSVALGQENDLEIREERLNQFKWAYLTTRKSRLNRYPKLARQFNKACLEHFLEVAAHTLTNSITDLLREAIDTNAITTVLLPKIEAQISQGTRSNCEEQLLQALTNFLSPKPGSADSVAFLLIEAVSSFDAERTKELRTPIEEPQESELERTEGDWQQACFEELWRNRNTTHSASPTY